MLNLFSYLGYTIFFWANENGNQYMYMFAKVIHGANATKVWLTKSGDSILANNSRIPEHDLNKILKSIRYNFFYIISEWKVFYGVDELRFYC